MKVLKMGKKVAQLGVKVEDGQEVLKESFEAAKPKQMAARRGMLTPPRRRRQAPLKLPAKLPPKGTKEKMNH
jgi:hypothetical protein